MKLNSSINYSTSLAHANSKLEDSLVDYQLKAKELERISSVLNELRGSLHVILGHVDPAAVASQIDETDPLSFALYVQGHVDVKVSELKARLDELSRDLNSKTHELIDIERQYHSTQTMMASSESVNSRLRDQLTFLLDDFREVLMGVHTQVDDKTHSAVNYARGEKPHMVLPDLSDLSYQVTEENETDAPRWMIEQSKSFFDYLLQELAECRAEITKVNALVISSHNDAELQSKKCSDQTSEIIKLQSRLHSSQKLVEEFRDNAVVLENRIRDREVHLRSCCGSHTGEDFR